MYIFTALCTCILLSYNTGKCACLILGMGDTSTKISIPILKVLWVSSNFLKESKFQYL